MFKRTDAYIKGLSSTFIMGPMRWNPAEETLRDTDVFAEDVFLWGGGLWGAEGGRM